MFRALLLSSMASIALMVPLSAGESLSGTYVEARTCQVYTGPCFANGEVGLMGKNAVMSWNIQQGQYEGIDLTGLSVAVVVSASHTLGFGGLGDARQLKLVVYVDENATSRQQLALVEFARSHAGTGPPLPCRSARTRGKRRPGSSQTEQRAIQQRRLRQWRGR